MDRNLLFVETCNDLARRVLNPDPSAYDLLMASACLRRLLLDSPRLADLAARPRDFKVTFTVPLIEPPPEDILGLLAEARIHIWLVDLDVTVMGGVEREEIAVDDFLARSIGQFQGSVVTVYHLIHYMANVEGGVHAGRPKKQFHHSFVDLAEEIFISGAPGFNAAIVVIGAVVLRSLKPLIDTVAMDVDYPFDPAIWQALEVE